jgi:hypothetical protein
MPTISEFLSSNADYGIDPPYVEPCELCDGTGIDADQIDEYIDGAIHEEELTIDQVKKMTFNDKVKFVQTVVGESCKCKCLK